METLWRFREAAVTVVLVVLGVRLVLVAAAALTPLTVGVESGVDAAYLVSSQLGEVSLFVLLAALVAACHARPVTSRARPLAWTALVTAGAALLVVLLLPVLGYASFPSPLSRMELASRLLGLVLPAAAVVALGLLVARPASGRLALGSGSQSSQVQPVRDEAPAALSAAAPDPQLEPTWTTDTAAGAVWSSAGEAASGRPASGWGASDPSAGWQPGPQHPVPRPDGTPPGPLTGSEPAGAGPTGLGTAEAGEPVAQSGPAASPPAPERQPPHPWSSPRP